MTEFWTICITLNFLFCILLNAYLTPRILIIAKRKKLYDKPNERTIHRGFIPRLGGLAFNPIITFTIAFTCGMIVLSGHSEILKTFTPEIPSIIFSFCALTIISAVGLTDDLIGIRYRKKFLSQIICALLLIAGGIYITNFSGLFGISKMPNIIATFITIPILLFVTNAINLIDGIDGLASGLTSVATLFYGILFFSFGNYLYAMLSFATLGVLIPFFIFNVFGNAQKGNKIFMGDTGSLTIGVLVCLLSIRLFQLVDNTPLTSNLNPFIVAFSPLIIPCFDVLRVFLHRIKIGKDPFLPDKNHIHHKLMAIGYSQHKTMIFIILLSTVITATNIFLSKIINVNILFLIDIISWTMFNIYLNKRITIKKTIPPKRTKIEFIYEH